ncbi:MAG: alkaline phosphatase family protein [Oligoflexia bacterium]|nr:alkaline phosphatase family protein [Oligoflexia bacterium]
MKLPPPKSVGLALLLSVSLSALPATTSPASGALVATATPLSTRSFQQKPKLIVVIVVDQLRADYLTRFQPRFLPARRGTILGGYNTLISEGAYFPFAQYDVLQCMTGPGHAMILSGSYPYQMGIPLNGWFDETTRKTIYCAQDDASPVVGGQARTGLSPRNFTGNTLGDELKNAGYASRVVTVALKDRSAILLGGHRADLAFWFDGKSHQWVSSTFYLPEKKLPAWLTELNSALSARKGKPISWKSEGKPTGLTANTEPFERKASFGDREALSWPLGVELTAAAAEKALDAFKLGRGPATDLLAISFSSHDYLGHQFGPNSREMEEMTVAEDRILSRFLNRLNGALPGGLSDALIVLTADHGIPAPAKWLNSVRHPAGRVNGDKLKEQMEARLVERFGKPEGGKWVIFHADLNWTLAPEAVASGKATRAQLEQEMKAVIKEDPGIAYVFSRTDYLERKLPPGMLERQILKTYIPGRSGDVVGIPRAYYSTEDDAVDHMTSYTYDRTVPLVIAGSRIRKGVYATPADVIDVAPTLAFLTGILAPATSEGRVLAEILTEKTEKPAP